MIDYLSDECFISANILKGRVCDRNFLFGNYKDGDFDNKIEGIVNYRKVVVPCRTSGLAMIQSTPAISGITMAQSSITAIMEYRIIYISIQKCHVGEKCGRRR